MHLSHVRSLSAVQCTALLPLSEWWQGWADGVPGMSCSIYPRESGRGVVMAEQALVVLQTFDQDQIDIMRKTIAKETTPEEFRFFLEVCKYRGLNPFNREIYAIPGKGGKTTFQVSIDGLRLLAERSGKYKGQLGPFYCAEDGEWREVWLSKTPPAAAKVGVIRAG